MLPHEIQQFMGSGAFASSDPLFHSDTIHHVEFDFYGKRVVTVSSDKLVCIWDKEVHGNWKRSASWKGNCSNNGSNIDHDQYVQSKKSDRSPSRILFGRYAQFDRKHNSPMLEHHARSLEYLIMKFKKFDTLGHSILWVSILWVIRYFGCRYFGSFDTLGVDTLGKHGGAVWKARFAHPEFGQVLATCSFDNTIQIFDKDAVDVMDARSSMSASDFSNGWVCRTVLRQSTSSITDIQFAPHYLGLQLAACTSSGRLVIYEAEDIMALDNWNVLVDNEICQHRLCSLSWSRSRFDPPYIALASDDADAPAEEKVFLFRVVNTGIFPARVISSTRSTPTEKQQHQKSKDYKFLFEDPVSMLAFGPSCGLGIHKLAIAVGTRLLIYQLQLTMTEDHNQEGSTGSASETAENQLGENTAEQTTIQQHFVIKSLDVLEEGNSQLVRFAWNILGDILSAVYADGLVRIWRCIFTFYL
ncbi:unnamed protein product [Meloidogyne enterolobii]|uniref:Uncharacterized protein n=1 Tax=Meloidogyne enterolobii TaxID=390850 RepID=A0ACB0ZI75_MELEN